MTNMSNKRSRDISYFVPVLRIRNDTPVFKFMNEDIISLVSGDEIIDKQNNIVLQHVGDNPANISQIGEINPMPYPLVNDPIKSAIIELLKFSIFAIGYNYVQFLDVLLKIGDNQYKYNILHVMNFISCMDMKNSSFETLSDDDIFAIDELVLDYEVLATVPLDKRLIFRLEELPILHLFEKSIGGMGDVAKLFKKLLV